MCRSFICFWQGEKSTTKCTSDLKNAVSSHKITRKQIQTTKSSNCIGLKKNLQAYTQPYSAEHWKLLVSFYHFHWSSRIPTNLPNPITHLIVTSLEITKKRFYIIKSSNFIGHNIFASQLHTSLCNTLYILKFFVKLVFLISFFITSSSSNEGYS